MREKLEFWLVMIVARPLGWLPREAARLVAGGIALFAYCLLGRLRRVGQRNLELAFPTLTTRKRRRILLGVFRSLGRLLVEFCRMARYTPENTRDWIRTEGLDRYLAAKARGKGVLVVTGHLGAWELSSFYHSLMGYPMGMVVASSRQPPPGHVCQRYPLHARQPRAAQGRFCARPAHRHA